MIIEVIRMTDRGAFHSAYVDHQRKQTDNEDTKREREIGIEVKVKVK